MIKAALASLVSCALVGCAAAPKVTPAPTAHPAVAPAPNEVRFKSLRQLTFGGENAEAYWSFDGRELIYQARPVGEGCDRIYRMDVTKAQPSPEPVSNGQGATTCSYFLPGDKEVIFASTQGAGPACPKRPDMSQGYVWALYDSYDIYRANRDGTAAQNLTHVKGYDAEGTVCAKDGSIVFTSTRDGDIELYRMDKDGGNVRRLTHEPGYDGGAFFSPDCSKIVWRASRPKPRKELEDYQRLLAQGLVRPTQLELYVANADGSDARQITYLGAASFAPFWHPNGKRILFSSNVGDPHGREFDLWAVNVDGTQLERITYAAGFDGFPMFSPDGKTLAFSSNRATPPGQHDTNVFLAEWDEDAKVTYVDQAPDRIRADIAYLADPAREGRGLGTQGLAQAGAYLEARFKAVGLAPAVSGQADDASFRQTFPVVTELRTGPKTGLRYGGKQLGPDAVVPLGFSARGTVQGGVVLAGYGLYDPAVAEDDYQGVNAKGKLVVVRRFVPETPKFSSVEAKRRYGDLRFKAWVAKEKGAKGLIVIDAPLPPPDAKGWSPPDEAKLPEPHPEGAGDAGLPVVMVRRAAAKELLALLEAKKSVQASLTVELDAKTDDAFNVVGRLSPGAPQSERLPGVVVVGAHYDHLGLGGESSLAPGVNAPHLGADDNASGTSALLEVARELAEHKDALRREVLFVAFSGEEAGVLGSTYFVRHLPKGVVAKDVVAMLNMDMVGRMRDDQLQVLGAASAAEWSELLSPACEQLGLRCSLGGDGYGPSDQTPFFAAQIPVLHFFTGAHSDYHKPSDTVEKINAAGAAQVARLVSTVAKAMSERTSPLTYRAVAAPLPRGDLRSFNASLGTIPDYTGTPKGERGMRISGVRPGGAAEQAGIRGGDVLIRLGKHEIGSVEDLMYALNAQHPGDHLTAVVMRDGKPLEVPVVLQESHR